MRLQIKGPSVREVPGERFRYWVKFPDSKHEYLVDVEARFPATRCTCKSYDCTKWPETKRTGLVVYCKHSAWALVYHGLRDIRERSTNLEQNEGD